MNALTIRGTGDVSISVLPDAINQRTAALEEASGVSAVTDALTFEVASGVARALQGILKGVEKARTEVRAPVLELGKKIDATAKDFLAPVQVEFERVSALLTAYQREQMWIAEEARRKAEIEAAKARAEQARKESEARRREEEARRAAENAVTEDQHAAAQAQAEKAKQEAAAIAAAPVAIVAPTPVAPTAAGIVARKEWTFELSDIEALAKSRPELVTITPRRAEILTRIRAGERDIPGLRIFEDVRTTVRA